MTLVHNRVNISKSNQVWDCQEKPWASRRWLSWAGPPPPPLEAAPHPKIRITITATIVHQCLYHQHQMWSWSSWPIPTWSEITLLCSSPANTLFSLSTSSVTMIWARKMSFFLHFPLISNSSCNPINFVDHTYNISSQPSWVEHLPRASLPQAPLKTFWFVCKLCFDFCTILKIKTRKKFHWVTLVSNEEKWMSTWSHKEPGWFTMASENRELSKALICDLTDFELMEGEVIQIPQLETVTGKQTDSMDCKNENSYSYF